MYIQPIMRKLSVRRESLRELTATDLQHVAAGYTTVTRRYTSIPNESLGNNNGDTKTGA